MDSVGVARRRHRLKSLEKSKLNACNPYPIFGFSCQCVSPNSFQKSFSLRRPTSAISPEIYDDVGQLVRGHSPRNARS